MKETPCHPCQGKYARRVFQNTLANVPSAVDREITENVIRASSSRVPRSPESSRSETTITGSQSRYSALFGGGCAVHLDVLSFR
jgi:hypothetical protein